MSHISTRRSILAFVVALAVLSSCGSDSQGTAGKTAQPTPPTFPDVLWRSYGDAAEAFRKAELAPVVAGLDAQEVSPSDDWLVVGVSDADRFGNVGVSVASPNELGDGVRVDLLSDSVILYASIRKGPRDVWVHARLVGDDPVGAANNCAQGVLEAIGDEDLVVLCYLYDNRDRFDAEARDENAEPSSGLFCARAYGTAYGTAGAGGHEPHGQDLGQNDAACPAGVADDIGAGIERVPLPPGAVPLILDENGSGGPARAHIRIYTVPGSTFQDLVDFYNTVMPAEAPWLGWSWCEQYQGNEVDERTWTNPQRSGTGLLRVSLAVLPDGDPYVEVGRQGHCSHTSN